MPNEKLTPEEREAALRDGNSEVVERLHEIVETYTPDESARQAG